MLATIDDHLLIVSGVALIALALLAVLLVFFFRSYRRKPAVHLGPSDDQLAEALESRRVEHGATGGPAPAAAASDDIPGAGA
jgi:hypothetical protein